MANTLISGNDSVQKYRMTGPTSSTSTPADETAIRSLYQQLMDGWNKGNSEAFAAPFAEDSDLVGFDGTHLNGRQNIISFHQQLFDNYVKGSRLVGKVSEHSLSNP
ncbi:MAG: SgcJ/EcaC family oxidoreductase [Nitrososphaeraceae archaeon]